MEKKQIISLEDIASSPESFYPDITKWVKELTQDPSLNGWEEKHNGVLSKKYPKCQGTVYVKKVDNEPIMFTRMSMDMQDVDFEKFYSFVLDFENRRKWDEQMKEGKLIQQFNSHFAIWYLLYGVPFPMADRDVVMSIFAVNNWEHAELFKKFELPESDEKVVFGIAQPIQIQEYPEAKGVVRANIFQLLYGIKTKEGFRMESLAHVDMGGNIPGWLINAMMNFAAKQGFEKLMDQYVLFAQEN